MAPQSPALLFLAFTQTEGARLWDKPISFASEGLKISLSDDTFPLVSGAPTAICLLDPMKRFPAET